MMPPRPQTIAFDPEHMEPAPSVFAEPNSSKGTLWADPGSAEQLGRGLRAPHSMGRTMLLASRRRMVHMEPGKEGPLPMSEPGGETARIRRVAVVVVYKWLRKHGSQNTAARIWVRVSYQHPWWIRFSSLGVKGGVEPAEVQARLQFFTSRGTTSVGM